VAGEEACRTVSRWEVVQRIEAHWRCLSTARQSVARWLMTMAWTSGCRSRTWGREAPENNEEACSMVGWLGGGQSAVVDGKPLVEEEAVRDGALPGIMAGGSSSKVFLHLQRKTAVRFIGSFGEGVG
jgi:hypothetical protein